LFTSEDVISYVNRAIHNDRIKIKPGFISEPSGITNWDTGAFGKISKTIVEVMPGSIVTPGLTRGSTDTKHYKEVTDYIYRFAPDL